MRSRRGKGALLGHGLDNREREREREVAIRKERKDRDATRETINK